MERVAPDPGEIGDRTAQKGLFWRSRLPRLGYSLRPGGEERHLWSGESLVHPFLDGGKDRYQQGYAGQQVRGIYKKIYHRGLGRELFRGTDVECERYQRGGPGLDRDHESAPFCGEQPRDAAPACTGQTGGPISRGRRTRQGRVVHARDRAKCTGSGSRPIQPADRLSSFRDRHRLGPRYTTRAAKVLLHLPPPGRPPARGLKRPCNYERRKGLSVGPDGRILYPDPRRRKGPYHRYRPV